MVKTVEEDYLKNDIIKAFIAGAKWWEYHSTESIMWQSDQNLAMIEAIKRYGSLEKLKKQQIPCGYSCSYCGDPNCEGNELNL